MYTDKNYKTKKELKNDVADGIPVRFYQPGPFSDGSERKFSGTIYLEGPHYPQPHRWYAQAVAVDGVIVKVK